MSSEHTRAEADSVVSFQRRLCMIFIKSRLPYVIYTFCWLSWLTWIEGAYPVDYGKRDLIKIMHNLLWKETTLSASALVCSDDMHFKQYQMRVLVTVCLLYTSDAADE